MRIVAPHEFSPNRFGLQTLQLCWYSGASCTFLVTPGQPVRVGGSMTLSVSVAFSGAGHIDFSTALFKWEFGSIPV